MSDTMTIDEKILKSLKLAAEFLNGKDETSLADNMWHIAAELEYALFLLSIKLQDEIDASDLKSSPESKKADMDSVLGDVKSLLKEAEEYLLNGKLKDAYGSAYVARQYTLRIIETIDKKKI